LPYISIIHLKLNMSFENFFLYSAGIYMKYLVLYC